MAGDWIKVEHTLPDKPEIFRIAEYLGIDPDAVVGKLVRFWSWCDQQTINGDSLGVSPSVIDHITRLPGFSDALRKVDWLQARSGSLAVPHFDRHNGQTAKARAVDNRKKAIQRDRGRCPENVPMPPGQKPGPEKRREEKNPVSLSLSKSDTIGGDNPSAERGIDFCEDSFPDKIVAAYPANGDRRKAMEAVAAAIAAGENPAEMLAAVQRHAVRMVALSAECRRYCPGLTAYFGGRRWLDDPTGHPWTVRPVTAATPADRAESARKEALRKESERMAGTAAKAPVVAKVADHERPSLDDFRAAKAIVNNVA